MIAENISGTFCSVVSLSPNGNTHRKAYVNSTSGREDFMRECALAENYIEVMAAWGDAPTVDEPGVEPMPAPSPTPVEQLRADVDYLLIAEMQREGLL